MFLKNLLKKIDVKTILYGIILYILCSYIIGPLITILNNFSGNLWNAIVDSVYSYAAKTTLIALIFSLFSPILGMSFGIASFPLTLKKKWYNTDNGFKTSEERNQQIKKLDKKTKKLQSLLLVLLLSFLVMFIVFTYIPASLKNGFDISIAKITPYATTLEIDTLKSDWTRMKGKADYKKIQLQIDNVIKSNTLE